MIKKFMISVFVLAIVFGGIYFTRVIPGLASAQTGTTNQEEVEDPFRYVENIAFGIGERFDFDIGYGFINAGYATMEVRELIEYDGRP